MSSEARKVPITLGPYAGEVDAAYCAPELFDRLAELPRWLASPSAWQVAAGRNRHVCVDLPTGGGSQTVIVKVFGPQPWVKDLRDRRRGSKSRRSWLAATHLGSHGVGTPRAIGYLERLEGLRLRESYFLAAYRPGVVSFREALRTLLLERPECAELMELLECVAVKPLVAPYALPSQLGNAGVSEDGYADYLLRYLCLALGALTYAHGPAMAFPREETFARVEDAFGEALDLVPDRLTGRPVYLRGTTPTCASRPGT